MSGKKTWEMRSRNTRVRGRIALIRKGSKTVVGVADLVDTLTELSPATLRAKVAKHQLPTERIGDDYNIASPGCSTTLGRSGNRYRIATRLVPSFG